MGVGNLLENFKFKKNLGQNFILDTNFQKAIVSDCQISKSDDVLEIGTGAGTLTCAIADACNKVVTYEKDTSLKEILDKSLDRDNIVLHFDDILSKKLEDIESEFDGPYHMIANLPYYITTPIIFHFLPSSKLKTLNIMVQKEVAERICAKPGSKDYGILTLMIQFYGTAKIVRHINRNMYVPSPKVDSAMVRIELHHNFDSDIEEIFDTLVHTAFAMRRKTLRNNLIKGMDLDSATIDKLLEGYPPAVRGEDLSYSDYITLSNRVIKLFQ